MRKEMYDFFNSDKAIKSDLIFNWENCEAIWIGESGLKVQIRFTPNTGKVRLTNYIKTPDVAKIEIYPGNFPPFELIIKKSILLQKLQGQSPDDIVLDENYFNILEGSEVYEPTLKIRNNSIEINYKINRDHYFLFLNDFKGLKIL